MTPMTERYILLVLLFHQIIRFCVNGIFEFQNIIIVHSNNGNDDDDDATTNINVFVLLMYLCADTTWTCDDGRRLNGTMNGTNYPLDQLAR